MFKTLLRTPPTVFAFFSGLMVSVATSAAAQIAFAEQMPSNRGKVLASGTVALVAGVLWFLLSECIGAADRKVDELAPALKSREAALESLPRRSKAVAMCLFLLASFLSVSWPWVEQLGDFLKRIMSHTATLFS